MTWADGLNRTSSTYNVAVYDGSPLRVIAGPGTGKTFALMRRIARLLEEGADPKRMLVVTFTRTAAYDLEQELGKLGYQASKVVHGTLHSRCFSILQQNHVFDITRRVARPLLDFEQRFLIEDLDHKELFGNVHERRQHIQALAAAWAREQTEKPGVLSETDLQVRQEMLDWLMFHDAILLAELVPLTLDYLRTNPGRPERHQFDHVLVDEYQDWNLAEQRLIDLLAKNGTLTVVGDEDQSVYEDFRYAHPEGISEFGKTHPGTHDEPLAECRRCPSQIVTIANELIRHNVRRTGRILSVHPSNIEGDIHIVQWDNMWDEADGIADYITIKVDPETGDFTTGETLVLSPSRELGYLVRDALRKRNVQAHSFFNEQLFDGQPKELNRCQAQEAFTLLTLIAHPKDRVALRCYLGFGHKSLRRESYGQLMRYCSANGCEPRDALEELLSGTLKIPSTRGLVDRYRLLAERLAVLDGKSGREIFDNLFPDGLDWAEPFRELAEAEGFVNEWTPQAILKALREKITHPEVPMDVPYVRVMSLHKSKGLSADLVIVLGCVEGLIPRHPKAHYPPERKQLFIEEQRRLFYVAITRPKRTLVLSSVLQLPRDFAQKQQMPVVGRSRDETDTITSSFIAELGSTAPTAVRGCNWVYD